MNSKQAFGFSLIVSGMIFYGCASPQKGAATSAPAAVAEKSTVAAPTVSAPAQKTDALTCTGDSDVRTVVIRTKDDGCQVEYTKFGSTKMVASSHTGTAHCVEALKHIKEKLEASAYKCN